MAESTEMLRYSNPFLTGEFRVERIAPARIEQVARHVERVLAIGYMRAFEEQNTLISTGAIKKHLFDPEDDDRIAKRATRMLDYMQNHGSSYWIGWLLGEDDNVEAIGLAKVSPSRPHRLAKAHNLYVNDIIAVRERAGVGSAMLHASSGDYEGDGAAVLDAFVGNNKANLWFKRLGFAPKGKPKEPYFSVGDERVPQIRLEMPSVRGLRTLLAHRHKWLNKGVTS